jgi:hypothetical protein
MNALLFTLITRDTPLERGALRQTQLRAVRRLFP